MNNTFSFQRFTLLLKRQWLEFGKIYLISLAVLAGIITIFYWINLSADSLQYVSNSALRFRIVLFVICGFFFITIISSTYFSHLGQKAKATIDLMIPASTVEKFLAGLFYTTIVATVSYLLVFWLIDFAMLFKIRQTHQSTITYTNELGQKVVTDNITYFFTQRIDHEVKFLYFFPFLFNSIFLLGSIYFNRFHYLKTAISVMIFTIAWGSSFIYIMNRATRDTVWVGTPFWQEKDHGLMLVTLMGIMLTLIFWTIGYIRLKEKEV